MFGAHVPTQGHTRCFLSSVGKALLFSACFVGEKTEASTILFFLPEIHICSLFFALAVGYPVSSAFPVAPSMLLCAMGNLKRFLVAYYLYNETWE